MWENVRDAVGWFVALVWHRVTNARHTWRESAPAERFALVFNAAAILLWTLLLLFFDAPLWAALVLGLCIVGFIADLENATTRVAERARALRLLEATPTGAPRLARVRCSNGTTHEFSYGPDGWVETKHQHELVEG